jgi:hypothetical protein
MGQNEQGQKYNGLALIFRSADQIDRFIANDTSPPRANGVVAHLNPDERRRAISEANGAAWLAQSDPNVIDMES